MIPSVAPSGHEAAAGHDRLLYAFEWAVKMEKISGRFESPFSLWTMKDALQMSVGGDADSVQITASAITVAGIIWQDVNLTASFATGVGNPGGSGQAQAVSLWYAVHLIMSTNGDDLKLYLDISGTAPTLPVGYPWFRRVGWRLNDAAADFYPFKNAVGSNWFKWDVDETVLPFLVYSVTTSSITPVLVPCAGAAPLTSDELRIVATIASGATSLKTLFLRDWDLANLVAPKFLEVNGKSISQMGNIECNPTQQIGVWTTNTSHDVDVSVMAYRDIR